MKNNGELRKPAQRESWKLDKTSQTEKKKKSVSKTSFVVIYASYAQ